MSVVDYSAPAYVLTAFKCLSKPVQRLINFQEIHIIITVEVFYEIVKFFALYILLKHCSERLKSCSRLLELKTQLVVLTTRMEMSCLWTSHFNKFLTLGKASVTLLITFTSNLSIRYKPRLLADRSDDVSMTRYDLECTMRKELSSSSSSRWTVTSARGQNVRQSETTEEG